MNWKQWVSFFLWILINPHLSLEQTYDPTTLVFPTYLHTYGIRKATRFHLFMFFQNRVKFRDPQALAVVRLQAWEDSTTERDDDEVTVYGVNSGQNNIIYNRSMTSLGVYGLEELGIQRLNRPHGIAANSRGDVYIADTGNHRIVRLFNPGRALKYASAIGDRGSSPGKFYSPYGVALDSQGRIYVTDRDNHRIQVLDKDNRFLRQFGFRTDELCRLISPTGIAVIDSSEKWNFHKDSFIVVIDSMNQRIQKLSLRGKRLAQTNALKCGYPNANLLWTAIDYYGQIYVTDRENHCIHKFDRRLKYLTKYGRNGTADKEFIEPRGITIYRRFGQLFVAEEAGAQYYWIGVDVFNFRARFDEKDKWVHLRFFLTEPSFITGDVFDDQNEFVTKICEQKFMLAGFQQDYWNLRISQFEPDPIDDTHLIQTEKYRKLNRVPPGRYVLKFKFEPTYSSYQYFFKEKQSEIIVK